MAGCGKPHPSHMAWAYFVRETTHTPISHTERMGDLRNSRDRVRNQITQTTIVIFIVSNFAYKNVNMRMNGGRVMGEWKVAEG